MQQVAQSSPFGGYLFGMGCGYRIAYPAATPSEPDSVDPAAGIDREALLPEIRSRSTGSRPKTKSGNTRKPVFAQGGRDRPTQHVFLRVQLGPWLA